MSTSPISGYGQPPGQGESQMEIDRRNLLWATAYLAMTKLVGPASSQTSPGRLR